MPGSRQACVLFDLVFAGVDESGALEGPHP